MSTPTFADFDLHPQIERALSAAGYSTPTPIQAESIPHLLEGTDLLGSAQTGTGKTAAFAIPILDYLGGSQRKAKPKTPRVLILSPTRELAAQIGDSFQTYGKFLHLRQTVVFGGVGQGKQVQAMKRGVHILIATPGRLLDLMGQGYVSLDDLEIFVLDEADRMLDMGFLPDLKRIISNLPEDRQSVFFSATLPPKVAELAESLLTDPVRVEITPESPTVELIEQQVMYVPRHAKPELLSKVLEGPGVGKSIVFTKTKHGADKVAKMLNDHGLKAEAIHGNKSQNQRTRTLNRFRGDRLDILVATDVAARGIDVDGLTHVINFDLPIEPENYVHRIGRTGRAGASGMAISFCDAPTERKLLKEIERLIKQAVPVHADHPDRSAPWTGRDGESRPRRSNSARRRPGGSRPGQRRRGASPGEDSRCDTAQGERRRTRREGSQERTPNGEKPRRFQKKRRFSKKKPAHAGSNARSSSPSS